MIHSLTNKDFEEAINIVNDNWKSVYVKYVNPNLLNDKGCKERSISLKKDFLCQKLNEYVFDIDGQVVALLSIGDTKDADKIGTFEIWRIYIIEKEQGKGIGSQLLDFAEQYAKEKGYTEILVWAFKENTHAIKFYLKHGYQLDKEEYLGVPYLTYGSRLLKTI